MESEKRNFVIEYEDWDSYNAKSKDEAIEMFKKEHSQAEILNVRD